jgi:hypothetical protein
MALNSLQLTSANSDRKVSLLTTGTDYWSLYLLGGKNSRKPTAWNERKSKKFIYDC